jgi:hypothetical protein
MFVSDILLLHAILSKLEEKLGEIGSRKGKWQPCCEYRKEKKKNETPVIR